MITRVILVLLTVLVPFFGNTQIVFEENKKVDEKKLKEWRSENIRNYFSLSAGLAIPTGDFRETDLSTTNLSGYAETGYHFGGGLHYFIRNTIGIIGSFRYSTFGYDTKIYAEQWDQALRFTLRQQGVNSSNLTPTTVKADDYEMYNISIGASVRTPTIEMIDFEFGLKLTYTIIDFPTIDIENQFFMPIVEDFVNKQVFTPEPFARFHVRFGDNMGGFLHASYNGIESELEYSPKTIPAASIGASFPLDMKNVTLGGGLAFIFR